MSNEDDLLQKVQSLLGEEYNPLICRAKNAIALQKLADAQIGRTIRKDAHGKEVIINKERPLMIQLVNNANNAMEALVRHVVKSGKEDAFSELLKALRDSTPEVVDDGE